MYDHRIYAHTHTHFIHIICYTQQQLERHIITAGVLEEKLLINNTFFL